MARVLGEKEIVLSWLYDTNIFLAGIIQTTSAFYQVALGNIIPGTAVRKTFAHTNIKTGGFLPSIQAFTISSFYMQAPPYLTSLDVPGMLNGDGCLTINDKPYPDHWTLSMFFAGPAWRESVRGPAAGPDFRAFTGDGRIDNAVVFKRPFLVTIDTFEPFAIDVNWVAPGFTPAEDLTLRTVMFGRLQRPVS